VYPAKGFRRLDDDVSFPMWQHDRLWGRNDAHMPVARTYYGQCASLCLKDMTIVLTVNLDTTPIAAVDDVLRRIHECRSCTCSLSTVAHTTGGCLRSRVRQSDMNVHALLPVNPRIRFFLESSHTVVLG